jgi:hypothetical protein
MLTTKQVEGELNMRSYFLGEPVIVLPGEEEAESEPTPPPYQEKDTTPFFEKYGSLLIVGFAFAVALAIFPEGESEPKLEAGGGI